MKHYSLSGSFLQKGGRIVKALSLFDVPVIEIVVSRNRQKECELNSCPGMVQFYKYYVAYKLQLEARETARKAREQFAPGTRKPR